MSCQSARAQNELAVGLAPGQLLEQPLRVDVHPLRVRDAVQARVAPEPVLCDVGPSRQPGASLGPQGAGRAVIARKRGI